MHGWCCTDVSSTLLLPSTQNLFTLQFIGMILVKLLKALLSVLMIGIKKAFAYAYYRITGKKAKHHIDLAFQVREYAQRNIYKETKEEIMKAL